jgi:hypothetical protein
MSEGFAYLLVMACLLMTAGCSDTAKMCAKHKDSPSCIQDVECNWDTDKTTCDAKPR